MMRSDVRKLGMGGFVKTECEGNNEHQLDTSNYLRFVVGE
jgi:hypothetical protein